jgi:hypothetical protein
MDCKEFCLLQWLIPMEHENRTIEMDYIECPIGIMQNHQIELTFQIIP